MLEGIRGIIFDLDGTIYQTMYANSEDFQVLAITTMVSSFVAEWYGRSAERHHE